MATMTVRNLDDQFKQRLRVRAAEHGRSMEDEVREILRNALSTDMQGGKPLVEAIRSRVAPLGGVELELPERQAIRTPKGFGA